LVNGYVVIANCEVQQEWPFVDLLFFASWLKFDSMDPNATVTTTIANVTEAITTVLTTVLTAAATTVAEATTTAAATTTTAAAATTLAAATTTAAATAAATTMAAVVTTMAATTMATTMAKSGNATKTGASVEEQLAILAAGIDQSWTLLTGFLVFFMQYGDEERKKPFFFFFFFFFFSFFPLFLSFVCDLCARSRCVQLFFLPSRLSPCVWLQCRDIADLKRKSGLLRKLILFFFPPKQGSASPCSRVVP
jgi:hypothetical protein